LPALAAAALQQHPSTSWPNVTCSAFGSAAGEVDWREILLRLDSRRGDGAGGDEPHATAHAVSPRRAEERSHGTRMMRSRCATAGARGGTAHPLARAKLANSN